MDSGVISWTLSLTALTTGLLGSLHCLGMCGGVSGTVALASTDVAKSSRRPVPVAVVAVTATPAAFSAEINVLAFNAGRIASYAIAGALAGTVGGALGGIGQGGVISETLAARTALFVFANLMIIATGLYLMGMPQLLAPLERIGGHLWRHISPLTRQLLPLRSAAHATLFGMVWGWIPCGMVYAMLLSAISAGSATGGMVTMFAFGLGTLPVMLATGWAAGSMRRWTRHPRVRQAAGAAVVVLGIVGLARLGMLEQLQAFGAYCSTLLPHAAPAAGLPP